jgi:DNA repair and recombination protein RAD52
MSFTNYQAEQLSAPLSSSNVSQRSQGGRKLSYIEGWHAIAEANRIFGFDCWDRETLEMRCVSERERAIGENKNPGWGVSYVARVRITVCADGISVTREGCGAGHGIDRDLGLAHESALKEAETDAMKRALMTFGNPFGLALYDKTQENVETPQKAASKAKADAKSKVEQLDPAKSAEVTVGILGQLEKITELKRVKIYAENVEGTHSSLVAEDQKRVSDAFRARMAFLKAAATQV